MYVDKNIEKVGKRNSVSNQPLDVVSHIHVYTDLE